jgi:hypothetical protein
VITAIAAQRLANQCLTRASRLDPAGVVRWFGAVQAQEYGPAKWALGLRAPEGTTEAGVQQALDDGRIVRTHAMRPTWHFVAAADCRWLLELTAPHVHKRMAPYDRRLGLDAKTMTRGARLLERAVRDRQYLTRQELGERLARANMPLDTTRLAHLCLYAELERVICSGPRRGKQSTYALFDERVPNATRLDRDEAIAELARRFLQSHGPATIRDFVWWSGLNTSEARRGIEMIGARRREVDGLTYWTIRTARRGAAPAGAHLLPIYDEYLVAYRDRAAVPHGSFPMMSFRPGAPFAFRHPLVLAGRVAGTWRPVSRAELLAIEVAPARRLAADEKRKIDEVAERYSAFAGTPVTTSIAGTLGAVFRPESRSQRSVSTRRRTPARFHRDLT